MFLHGSADLEWKLHRTWDHWHRHQDRKVERWEVAYVYTHFQLGHLPLQKLELPHCHRVAQWRGGRTRCQFWSPMSELVWYRCTCALEPPACVRILCCAIMARMASVDLIFMNHSRVSVHRSLHILMPRILKSWLLLFTNFGVRFFWSADVFPILWRPKTLFWSFRPYPI